MAQRNVMDVFPQFSTAPLNDKTIKSLSGMQTLDFSRATPKSANHFALDAYDKARFDASTATPRRGAWRIYAPGGQIQLKLDLPYKHGVVLIVELRRSRIDGADRCPITIKINGEKWERLNITNSNFHKMSWYVTYDRLNAGENLITLKLSKKAEASLLLKSASVMRFNLQHQKQTLWCWAAVTTSIVQFFDPETTLTQCKIVEMCKGKIADPQQVVDDCCPNERSRNCGETFKTTCNQTHKLSDALKAVGLLDSFRMFDDDHPVSLDDIRREISAGLPVAVRIGWMDKKGELTNRGHYVLITGVLPDDPRGEDYTWVRVSDPWDEGASYRSFGSLKNRYKDNGKWTYTYFIKKYGGFANSD